MEHELRDKGWDPLGRIAATLDAPYGAPFVDEKAMVAYWQRVYADEARAMASADLATEHGAACAAVVECEAAWKAARGKPVGSYLPSSWEREQEFRAAAIERNTLRHRLVRLRGRRDALAAELGRRGEG